MANPQTADILRLSLRKFCKRFGGLNARIQTLEKPCSTLASCCLNSRRGPALLPVNRNTLKSSAFSAKAANRSTNRVLPHCPLVAIVAFKTPNALCAGCDRFARACIATSLAAKFGAERSEHCKKQHLGQTLNSVTIELLHG
jgi:hypothetical protein